MRTIKFLLTLIVLFLFITNTNAQITSIQSGDWTEASTWNSGMIPTSNDDVIIGAGHIISVNDANAVCNNISFGDEAANIVMGTASSVLSIYGNFTNYSPTHIAFSSWAAGAKVKFTGSSETQTISNLNTSSTAAQTYFMELQVDKSSGKVTTTGTDVKLNIGTSLEVINGIFELDTLDDIQGRVIGNSPSSPDIIVQPGGVFTMVGGASHIRRASNTGEETKKIGLMTVYGTVELRTTSSNFLNFSGINIESGGLLRILTGWSTARFNPGTITVKSGGILENLTITNVWYENLTTPTTVNVNLGGTFNTKSTTTNLPPVFTNEGTFRYSRSAGDGSQTILDRDYYRLEISYDGDGTGNKTWTLGGNRIVADSLEINNKANFQIIATSPQTLTVNGTLRLTSGIFNNSDPNAVLQLADKVEISRATGQLTNAPTFLGNINLRYSSSTASVTTGPEFPMTDIINNLSIFSTNQTVTLGTDAKINGSLTLSAGTFDNNGENDDKTLTIADGSTIRRDSGILTVRPVLIDKVNLDYISTVYHVTTDLEVPDQTVALNNFTVSGDQGVTLGSDLYVNGELKLTGSDLETDEYMVILNNAARLNESAGKMVLGYVQATRNVNQSVMEDFGGMGLEITAQYAAPGNTVALRINHPRPDLFGGRRYFRITPNNNTGLNADMKYLYTDAEIENLNEENLVLFKSTDGGVNWTKEGGVININDNFVTLSGVNSFSLWAINDKNTPIVNIDQMDGNVPAEFSLLQNYPNPFNPSTTLEFTLANNERAKLKVFNSLGEEIKVLFDEDGKAGQIYKINFNGGELPSGIYFARLTQGSNQTIKKMILIK
jgi:hypothetical protein